MSIEVGARLNRAIGPSISGPESYAPAMVREGPVGLKDFQNTKVLQKNTMPTLQIGQVKQIDFAKPAKEIAPARPVLAKAAAIAVEAVIVKPTWAAIIPQIEPVRAPLVAPKEAVQPKPNVIVFPDARFVSQAETMPAAKPAEAVTTQTATEIKEQEEAVKEKVVIKKKQADETDKQTPQDLTVGKIKIVRAKDIARGRIQLLIEAIKKSGHRFKEALPKKFYELKSPVVGQGKDHTLDLTVQEVSSVIKHLSGEQPEVASVAAVENNAPVEEKEEGETATIEEYRKVVYGEQEKPKTPAEMVCQRVAQKEDFSRYLAEVLQKAA